MSREYTDKLLQAIEDGMLDRDGVIMACVKYMSEDDVADMCHCNEFFSNEDEDESSELDEDEVNAEFSEFWQSHCDLSPNDRDDKPAKRQAFSFFVDDLQRCGRISNDVANNVTLEGDD